MPHDRSPASLLDALLAYEDHVRAALPHKKADALLAQVRTALWRYTLPGWGFPALQGRRLTRQEHEQGLEFLKQLTLERLQDAPEVQLRLFEQLEVAGNSRRNYRWALNDFLDWCKQQPWYQFDAASTPRRSLSAQRARTGSANEVRLTTRKGRGAYRLAKDEMPEALQQELAAFSQYLTSGRAESNQRGTSPKTAQHYVAQVLRILGWLHTYQKVARQDLGLKSLVGLTPADPGKEPEELPAQAAAMRTAELVQAYLRWLNAAGTENEEKRNFAVQSPATELRVINIWLAVARFVDHSAGSSPGKGEEQTIPTLEALVQLRQQVSAKLKTHQPVSDTSKKQLAWQEFSELVEQLRQECVARLPKRTQSKQEGMTLGSVRSLTAIAQSYQRFLLTALLAYLPPQRQQVLRSLTVSQLALEPQIPDSEESQLESVLYQVEGTWWIKIVDPQWKRQPTHYCISVTDFRYRDGRCFYQYLQEWLVHYAYEDAEGRTVEVPGLRSCFKPQHTRLFTLKNGQPYEDAPAFIKLLRNPAYRLTGKALDFHSVRQTYADYLKQKELTEANCEKLPQGRDHEVMTGQSAMSQVDEDMYDPSDWQQAAEIAQAFLHQLPHSPSHGCEA